MSSLTPIEKRTLETFLEMSSGWVLGFSDRTFGEFVDDVVHVDIHSQRYTTTGTSKARKLRVFWNIESDSLVGTLLKALIKYSNQKLPIMDIAQTKRCKRIVARLLSGTPSLDPLKEQAKLFNGTHIEEQIRRMEASVETDPGLAIGTAKELIETCCKTILAERGQQIVGFPEIPTLTKDTMRVLKLVPDGIQDAAKGADVIKRLLNNLGSIGLSLAELRNLYGTGHGKHGSAVGLKPRHAKLAVRTAAAVVTFLFDTHLEMKK